MKSAGVQRRRRRKGSADKSVRRCGVAKGQGVCQPNVLAWVASWGEQLAVTAVDRMATAEGCPIEQTPRLAAGYTSSSRRGPSRESSRLWRRARRELLDRKGRGSGTRPMVASSSRGKRICIIGASGTGKTTLGKAIAQRLHIPFFDGDDYYHLPTDPPFQKQRGADERCTMIQQDLGGCESWVLSGGVAAWVPAPALDYTLLIFLYLPPAVRIDRLRRRERELYGRRILDGGDMARGHTEFMEWTAGYDDGSVAGTNTLPIHEALVCRARCPVLHLREAMTTDAQLERVLDIFGSVGLVTRA